VEFEWRSFLLRPQPRPGRSLEKFKQYTRSWLRPGAEPDSGSFREWETEHGPPSHSIPPHLLVKAAKRVSGDAARDVSQRLFQAYFADNLDITDPETMREIWRAGGLDSDRLEAVDDPGLLQEVLDEHKDALERGLTGVPAIMLVGNDVPITGAHPRDLYRRWIDRSLERARVDSSPRKV
jgi:predicted DsbA family dithiol-disulfide isomerase